MEPWKLQPARDLGLPAGQRLKSVRRESGLVEAGTQRLWWLLVRIYLRLAHRLSVVGRERLPASGSFVVVANHASHLDALVLASQLPRSMRNHVFPIAAGDTFFKTPISSAFAAATLNALPVWRRSAGRHALDELRERLGDEECVFILFPEGTRSRDGAIGPFKAGVGMLLAASNVPVVPCHLRGTFDALPPDRRLPRPAKIQLRIGAALHFGDLTNDRAGWEAVAQRLSDAVKNLEFAYPAAGPDCL